MFHPSHAIRTQPLEERKERISGSCRFALQSVSCTAAERIQNKSPVQPPLNCRDDGFGESQAAIWIRAIVAAQVRGTGDRQPATATPAPGGQHDRSHVRMALRFSTGLLGAPDSHEFDFIFGRPRALSLSPTPCDTMSPARIDGKLPVLSCMRASTLRAPPPWIYC